MFSLVKAGYGSFSEVMAMDTDEFLDAIEFEHISADIEAHLMNEARNGSRK